MKFLSLFASTLLAAGAIAASSFVSTEGTQFTLDGKPFYFEGTNTCKLHPCKQSFITRVLIEICSVADYLMNSDQDTVQQVFKQSKSLGLPVVRTWLFNLGTDSVWFQQWDAIKKQMIINDDSETGLGRIDYVIQQAAAQGIKLIFALNNNWEDYGQVYSKKGGNWKVAVYWHVIDLCTSGMDYYVKNFGGKYHDDFYTNEDMIASFKEYINHVVNRKNSLTGVKYSVRKPLIYGRKSVYSYRHLGGPHYLWMGNCQRSSLWRRRELPCFFQLLHRHDNCLDQGDQQLHQVYRQ